METVTASSILISVVCIFVVTGFIKAVNWVWLRPKRIEKWFRQQGLSGTSYQFLVGDMKDYSSMRTRALENPINGFSNDYSSRVDPLGHHHAGKFGKDYFVWAGPMPMVSIAKPELIREAFTNMQEFQKAKFNPVMDKLFPGLVRYEGEKWAKHRKIINPVFHLEKLKLMLPAFRDSCSEMINEWDMVVAETGSGEVDAWLSLTKLTADVISRAAFGSSYEKGQRIFELLKEQTDLSLVMLQSLYIPGQSYLPTPRNRRFRKLEDQIHDLLCSLINKRKDEIEAGEAVKSDLLGILMDSNLKEIQQAVGNNKNKHLGMSLQEVIEECKLFYLAGQETTSTLLVWAMILLSKHHDWQARAREEVLQTFGNNVPDFEGLNHLKTVTTILYEVLRLYPPVIQLSRMNKQKDTNLGALSIPSGTMIVFPMYSVYRDKEIWGDDAQEFKP
ncbi:hypothetical protein BVRB_5g116590 [Beta vulgaris subsp. vulgaris]|nr:hypothetical protein BVRB_5g116590 [Beta vulgaris subsp. vulgaris]